MNHQTRSRRTKIMGIVNVTPDSFSDGGKWERPGDAIKHGLDLIEQGADILDIGGESTRPGATPVPIVEEQRRVIPVIRELAQSGAIVSIDTYNAETAIAAAEAGARIVNDVSGGLADPLMASTVAALQVDYIATHWRGHLNGHTNTHYDDVVSDVSSELSARVAALLTAGVDPSKIHIDPGLGFSKDPSANWQILAHLKRFVDLGILYSSARAESVLCRRRRWPLRQRVKTCAKRRRPRSQW